MKIHLTGDHQGSLPEKLYLPESDHCTRGHLLLDPQGQPTDNLCWNADTGLPECAACAAHHLLAVQAILDHHQQDTSHCEKGHAVSADSYGIRWGKNGKPEAYCKDCGEIRKAQPAPIEIHPRASKLQ